MFEQATRMKLRWAYRGASSVEDLWDLRVEELDTIYKALRKKVRAQQEDSLLAERTGEDEVLSLKVNIIKHVVETKLAEAEERKLAAEKAARKQQIMGIIAHKQDEALMSLEIEELRGLLDEM